jgi:SWI/SNF-related matrix-associated actin-dependent regulator of chromatin subfamily A-like protein 1
MSNFMDLTASDGDDDDNESIEIFGYPPLPTPTTGNVPLERPSAKLDKFILERSQDPALDPYLREADLKAEQAKLQAAQRREHQLREEREIENQKRINEIQIQQQQQIQQRRSLPQSVVNPLQSVSQSYATNLPISQLGHYGVPNGQGLQPDVYMGNVGSSSFHGQHVNINIQHAVARPYEPMAQLTFSLVNLREFSVRSSVGRIDEMLLPTLQSMHGFSFDAKKQRIVFPLSEHQNLITNLRSSVKFQLFEQLDQTIINAAQMRMEKEERQTNESMKALDAVVDKALRDWEVPYNVIESLAPFQRQAVHFVCNPDTNNGRALVADEMGLGKTRTAIGCLCVYKEEWPVLIVCPSSARYHWRTELLALTEGVLDNTGKPYLPPECVTVVEGSSHPLGTKQRHREYKVVIISYNLVDTMYDKLRSMDFNVAILDESHYLKSSKTKRTKALKPITEHVRRCIMLSGTPALSRPMELFSQLNMLDPSKWSDVKEFGKRYCRVQKPKKSKVVITLDNGNNIGGKVENTSTTKRKPEFSGASNTHELHLILTDSLMIRRLKRNMLRNLPPKVRRIVTVAVENDDTREELAQLLQDVRTQEEEAKRRKALKNNRGLVMNRAGLGAVEEEGIDENEARRVRVNALMRLFSQSGAAKLPGIIEHLEQFLSNGASGKVLVFGHHRAVVEGISEFLDNNAQDYIRIDGRTPSSERSNLINRFQTDPGVRVAVLAITAAGVGITLTAAATVFFAEMFWTPGSLIQAEDRSHRIGQTSQVNICYFHAPNTVDELLWPLVREKMKSLGEIVEGTASDLTVASKGDRSSSSTSSSSSSSSSSTSKVEVQDQVEENINDDKKILDLNLARELALTESENRKTSKSPTEDDDEEEYNGAAVGDSDDEEPDPCPLAQLYMEQLRVEKRKRKHASIMATTSPYVPKSDKSSDYLLDGHDELDLLMAEVPGASPMGTMDAAYLEQGVPKQQRVEIVNLLDDTDNEEG